MDSTAVSSLGLGRRPENITRNSKDHHFMLQYSTYNGLMMRS